MRHKNVNKTLGREKGPRKSLFRATATNLFNHESIKTTLAKAKATKSYVEKMITKAKSGTLHDRREVLKEVHDKDTVKKFTQKLENRWLNASPAFVKLSAYYLKSLQKIDQDSYINIYNNYRTTREPVFVEILTGGLTVYDKNLEEYFENWSKSGNARVKKAGISGLKFLTKKKGN